MNVFERVVKITVSELGVKAEEVEMRSSFQDDLGADSLDVVELMMAFEDEFGVDISDEDAHGLKTVGDSVKYTENKLNK